MSWVVHCTCACVKKLEDGTVFFLDPMSMYLYQDIASEHAQHRSLPTVTGCPIWRSVSNPDFGTTT